ncbi:MULTISPECIES: hypothetical protein [Pseudomonas]|uniref:Uncharacterized protein n=1 Tax=Pseudomonas umsongensis TaxID=198618 RepID=A0ACC5M8S4_9PSED|nr:MULTISPECIES: hypothetical protein [Pseudomonas]MBB2884970.1 hypothetical protein [Pseudomonas umsongensis]
MLVEYDNEKVAIVSPEWGFWNAFAQLIDRHRAGTTDWVLEILVIDVIKLGKQWFCFFRTRA